MPNPTWQSRIIYLLNERQGSTKYEVWDIQPDREKEEIYQLAGSDQGIAHQASLFLATREYLEGKLGTFKIKDFINNFEDCWPADSNKSAAWTANGRAWKLPKKNRPKLKILNQELATGTTFPKEKVPDEGYWRFEFWPDRDIEEESYLLGGSLIEIQSQAFRIMHLRQLLDGVARVIGEPPTNRERRLPSVGSKLYIYLNKKKKPRFNKNEAYISIPFPNPAKLTYANIRAACGGDGGLGWGKEKAIAWVIPSRAELANYPGGKNAPQMHAHGSSMNEAIENLKKFLTLSSGYVIRTNWSRTDPNSGIIAEDPDRLNNLSYRVYPRRCTLMNSRLLRMNQDIDGVKTAIGKIDSKENDLPLYYSAEPAGWGNAIREILRWS